MMKKLLIWMFVFILSILVANADLNTDITAYYNFDTNFLDSANNYDLTNQGTDPIAGVINNGTDSDGTEYIEAPDYGVFVSNNFTIATWFKIPADTGGRIYDMRGEANFRVFIDNTIATGDRLTFDCTSSCTDYIVTNVTWADDTWYHLAIAVDDDTNLVTFYVNGVKVDTGDILATITAKSNPSSAILGIANTGGASADVPMSVDEFGIWNYTINSSDAIFLYNSGSGRQYPFNITSNNLTFTAKNVYDDSAILSFNITIDGTDYTTTTGTISTSILANDTTIYPVNFTASGFYPQNANVNASFDPDYEFQTYQSILVLTAKDKVKGTVIPNPTFIASAQSSNKTLFVNSGSIPVTFNKTGWFTNTLLFNAVALVTNNYDFDAHNSNVTFNFNQSIYDIGTYTLTVSNSTYSFSENTGAITSAPQMNLTNGYYLMTLYDGATILYRDYINVGTGDVSIDATFIGLNYLYFQDAKDSSPLVNASIRVTYPNANEINLNTDSQGRISFPTYTSQTVPTGDYTILFNGFTGYVTPITFTKTVSLSTLPFNTTYQLNRANIHINVYYRTNKTTLNKQVDLFIQSIGNFSTSTGNYSLTKVTMARGNYTIQAFSEGFWTEQRVVEYTAQENLSIDFYLLEINLSSSSTFLSRVVDITQSKIANAEVNLLEYDPVSLSYEAVSQAYTDADGEAKFIVELNDKTYKITASKIVNGELLADSTGDAGIIFRGDVAEGEGVVYEQQIVTLVLVSTSIYVFDPSLYLRYSIDENFNTSTNISNIEVDFYTTDGSNREVCIEFFTMDFTKKTSVVAYCVTGNAGTVTPDVPFLLNRSNDYRLEVYVNATDGSRSLLESFRYTSDTSFETNLNRYALLNPFALFFWIFIIGIGLYSGTLPIIGVLGIILTVIETTLFATILTGAGAVLKVIICIEIFYFGRKKEET